MIRANLNDPVVKHVRKDYAALRPEMTVDEALAAIRRQGVGEKIVYFYVLDADGRILGVLPTRRLLASDPKERLGDLMVKRVVAIPETATVLEACEFFVMHKFLAFPVTDEQGRMTGIVDVNLVTEEAFELAEQQQGDALFEAIGFRIAQVRDASPLKAFRVRFPWLLATITSGTACALLTSVFERILAESLVLAFFMALVLALCESVGIQSMTLTIQALRSSRPRLGWYVRTLGREMRTAALLGGACGTLVAAIVWTWRGEFGPALVIGLGIWLSLGWACLFGLSVPTLLHACRLDPRIAAGPVTLALTDVLTVLFYFTLAAIIL